MLNIFVFAINPFGSNELRGMFDEILSHNFHLSRPLILSIRPAQSVCGHLSAAMEAIEV